jgi:choice-of-anchor A domain-containing protein
LLGVALLGAVPAAVTAGPLPPATSSAVFVLTDVSGQNLSVTGGITAGGNGTFQSFAADSIYVQGNLALTSGHVSPGGVQYGGTFSRSQASVASATHVTAPLVDFPATQQALLNLSAIYGSLAPNGTVTQPYPGGLILTGSDPLLNVFDVSLSHNAEVIINTPVGSTVLINVAGTSPVIQNLSFTGNGAADPSLLLFNFPDAVSLQFSNLTIPGTVLAPGAAVNFSSGRQYGTLIADSLEATSVGFHSNPFVGDPPVDPVPEPSALALFALGAASLAAWRCRKKHRLAVR